MLVSGYNKIILLPNCTMLYYVFSGPLSLRAYVPEIKFNNNTPSSYGFIIAIAMNTNQIRFIDIFQLNLIRNVYKILGAAVPSDYICWTVNPRISHKVLTANETPWIHNQILKKSNHHTFDHLDLSGAKVHVEDVVLVLGAGVEVIASS